MTGTACELIECDEFENDCLDKFDLFSLYLFEKVNNDCMQIEDSTDFESVFCDVDPLFAEEAIDGVRLD